MWKVSDWSHGYMTDGEMPHGNPLRRVMAAGTDDPAVQRRRLRVELRKLRARKDRTQRAVAEAMEWSTSKLIRIENGDVAISANDLKVLLAYYGVTDDQDVDRYLEMCRGARREGWSEFRDILVPGLPDYLGFESSAPTQRTYENVCVPGLLQTDEYARALSGATGTSRTTHSSTGRQREVLRRRQDLHEQSEPPKMSFILDESVLHRTVGSDGVMRRQLERLKELGRAPHITLQIIPFTVGVRAEMREPFVLLRFGQVADPDVVYVEQATRGTIRDKPDVTRPYVETFRRLEALALSEEDTMALIDRVLGEMKPPDEAWGRG